MLFFHTYFNDSDFSNLSDFNTYVYSLYNLETKLLNLSKHLSQFVSLILFNEIFITDIYFDVFHKNLFHLLF